MKLVEGTHSYVVNNALAGIKLFHNVLIVSGKKTDFQHSLGSFSCRSCSSSEFRLITNSLMQYLAT